MRRDEKTMEEIRELSSKYGGRFDGVVQFKNFDTGEIVFNLYVTVDPENLVDVTPMLYSDVPEEDARAELDAGAFYDLILFEERDIRGAELESPPWAEKPRMSTISKLTNGVKGWLKGRKLMNSLKVYPESAEGDMKIFLKHFFEGMMGGGDDRNGPREGPGGCTSEKECREYCSDPDNREECEQFGEERRPEAWESKEVLTGEIILERQTKNL
jgi:hypothetical protein